MTVSQSKHEILWEPEDPRESVAATLALMRVDGLEPDEFGLAVMQRIADGEIDHDEAIAILLEQYRR